MTRTATAIAALIALTAACTDGRDARVGDALAVAGDNRAELQRVLDTFRGDTLRLAAAKFLIADMPHCASAISPVLDSIRHHRGLPDWDTTRQYWATRLNGTVRYVPDIASISADYIIENVNHAVDVWQSRPWSRHYSFDQFCQYVLPYRIADEPLENWRSTFHQRFAPILDSLYTGTDPVIAARELMTYIKQNKFRYIKEQGTPHHGAMYLLDNRVGECREACDLAVYILRALGIPAAIDCYITSPSFNSNHQWTALIDTNGMSIPFVYTDREINRIKHVDERVKGKVYRSTYGIQPFRAHVGEADPATVPAAFRSSYTADVTATYGNCADLSVDLFDGYDTALAYLGIFNGRTYIPIDVADVRHGKALFKDVEKDLVYFPVAWDGASASYKPCGYPLSHNRVFRPDTAAPAHVDLTRKYALGNTKYFIMALNGSTIQLASRPDFADARTVASFDSTMFANYFRFDTPAHITARHARFTCLDEVKAAIGEIHFFDGDCEVIPVRTYSTYTLSDDEQSRLPNVNDGIWDSYLLLAEPGCPIMFDFGRAANIDKVIFIPRNDDNFVRRGDIYELMYFAGPEGWKSLGQHTATGGSLHYDNVPATAMLWLRNHSRGKEEWPFYIQNDKQIFN